MPKKHRVKRQKYVEYLLKLEKERDAYLAKRKNAKRNRQARLSEENMGDARERAEVLPPQKRHRTEANTASRSIINKDTNITSSSSTNDVHREIDLNGSSTIANSKKTEKVIVTKDLDVKQETADTSDGNVITTSSVSTSFFDTSAPRLFENNTGAITRLTANNNDKSESVEANIKVKKTVKRRY